MAENNYRIEGESRQVGAIGIFESFTEIVNAETSREAYLKAASKLYANSREHVHVRRVELLGDNGHILVEPRAYL